MLPDLNSNEECDAVKCTYCGGKDLYLKRTWPIEVYGCHDCEKKIRYMREQGLREEQIKKIMTKKGRE